MLHKLLKLKQLTSGKMGIQILSVWLQSSYGLQNYIPS